MKLTYRPEIDDLYKKKIILHIGLSKTSSTFLQNHLDNINKINYKIFTSRNSSIFIKTFLKYLDNPDDKVKEYILSNINEAKNKTIIISSEDILGHQSNGFYFSSNRFKLLEELFKQPKYLIFFREPSKIIYSGFFQGKRKKFNLKFEEYINKDIDELKKIKLKNFQHTNYRVYDYNTILKEYLNIQDRVLFVEYENFFKEKKESKLNNFIGLNIKLNWNLRVNESHTNLKYFNFYDKFLFFKFLKIFCIMINKLYVKFLCKIYGQDKSSNFLSIITDLINILIKITPKKYIKEIDDNHKRLLEEIKSYHLDDYREFKKKLNPTLHILSN
tara:strand:+ start:172 stop:1161 length:990 start_codon:yes stop_codon:yes gene_type:complete